MEKFVKQNLDECVKEINNEEEKFENIRSVTPTPLKNNLITQNNVNIITKQMHCQDNDNTSNLHCDIVAEKNQVDDKLFVKKSNIDVGDDVNTVTDCGRKKNENLDTTLEIFIDQSKNNNDHVKIESIVADSVVGKRKHRLSSGGSEDKTPVNADSERKKRKKEKSTNDSYCWRCHKDIVEANCSACPRSWHRKCMGGTSPTSTTDSWICGECASILQAENAITRSPTMAHLTVDQLCLVLKYVIERMRNCPGAEPFWTAVSIDEVPNYLDYVVKPMDLTLLESNVNLKLYGSTDAFMADAKWIQHNCIVFNTCGGEYADTSKLTNAAKQIIKIARQEVSEIEACPDCYSRGRNLPRPHPSWFIEACRQPHPLIWAKLKGFPFWPAKALPRINGQGHVDVRFFGEHDRAWVSPKDIYLYSREPPTPLPRKKKQDMVECLREITQHCQKLEMSFGPFQFAPPRIQYNPHDPTQIKLIFPEYKVEYPCDNGVLSPSRKQLLSMNNSSTPKIDPAINDNATMKDIESTTERNIYGTGLKINDNVCSSEINVLSKQKNRSRKLSSAVEIDDEQVKPSDPSKLVTNPSVKNTKIVPSKISQVRKTLSKKFIQSGKCHMINDKLMDIASQKAIPKSRTNSIRKVNAASAPLLVPSTNVKINKSRMVKIYKPKTKIVKKLNSRKNETNEELSKLDLVDENKTIVSECITVDTTTSPGDMSNLRNSNESICESSATLSNSSVDMSNRETINGHIESQCKISTDTKQSPSVGKRQSKAKKSFPNKPPQVPKKLSISSTDTTFSTQKITNDTESSYRLPPPEAGPLCAQLNRGANELAVRMARLIEEVVQETAQSNIHTLGPSVGAYEATVYSLKLQIERMQWQHQQQLAELKYNSDQTLREMRVSLEAERLRAIEEIRKEAEEDKLKCIKDAKSKQWCAYCGCEALYYCCWNTAYCSYDCQQMHWQTHVRKCTQKPTVNKTTNDIAEANHSSQEIEKNELTQTMPTLIISTEHDPSTVRGA